MANKVLTIFEGDAKQLFATADQVEQRLKNIGQKVVTPPVSPAATVQTPIVEQQKATTAAVQAEVAKQVATVTTGAKQISNVQRQAAEGHIDFFKARQSAVERQAAGEIEMQGKVEAAFLKRQKIEIDARVQQGLFDAKVKYERLKLLADTTAIEEAETKVVLAESAKRAAAHSQGLLGGVIGHGTVGRGVVEAGLEGTGFARVAAGAAPTLAGFAVAVGLIESIKEYGKEVTESDARSKRFAVTSRDLGISQRELSEAVEITSKTLRTSKADAEALIGPVAELAGVTKRNFEDIRTSAIDLASSRGIDRSELPSLLNDIASGSANTALLGRNAASVFDLYADSIGKTADKLTETEKRQAVVNRLISDGTLVAGAQANSIENQVVSVDALTKSLKELGVTLGGLATPGAKAVIDLLTKGLGGEPQFGRFDPSRTFGTALANNLPGQLAAAAVTGGSSVLFGLARNESVGQKPEDLYAEDIRKTAEEVAKAHDEFKRRYFESVNRVSAALAAPDASFVNRALSRINLEEFKKLNPFKQQDLIDSVIADSKQVVSLQVKAYQDEVKRVGTDADSLRGLQRLITANKNIIGDDAFRSLSDQIKTALENGAKRGFEAQIEAAKNNVPRLRELYSQAFALPDVSADTRSDLARRISDQITQAVEAGKAKVKELGDSIRSVFDTTAGREGARNPFLQFLFDADRRMEKLIESTKGFSRELRNALVQREQAQNQTDLFGLRVESRVNAANLSDEARQFRSGKLDTDDRDFKERQRQLELQLRNSNLSQAQQDAARQGLEKQRQLELQQITQRKLQQQLDALRLQTGFEQFAVGQASGGDLPPGAIFRTRPVFNDRGLTDDEKAIRDRKIISLTQGLNPADLTPDQDRIAAEARENEAKRQLAAEKDAIEERKKQLEVQNKIATELKKLNDIAAAGGLDIILKIINEVPDNASVTRTKRATPAAVAEKYPN
jgi:hypothetical protein